MGEQTEWGESARCQGGFHMFLWDDLGPVKGTTRSLLPLLHSKPWEDPNQRCLDTGLSAARDSRAQASRRRRAPRL